MQERLNPEDVRNEFEEIARTMPLNRAMNLCRYPSGAYIAIGTALTWLFFLKGKGLPDEAICSEVE